MGSRSAGKSFKALDHDANTDSDLTSIPPPPRERPRARSSNRWSGRDQGGDGYFSRDYGPRDRRYGPSRRKKNYSIPPEKTNNGPRRIAGKETLILCVFRSPTRGWRTEPITFDPRKSTDQELWGEIRRVYRDEIERWWRRVFSFKRLRYITPVEYSRNDVPVRPDVKDFPDVHSFIHCFHHANRLRTNHVWVDWFVEFKKDPDKSYGLEFKECLWAEKLAVLAITITVAIIIVCIVWAVKGGDLQTIFTVMSFVLGGATAELALVALYYQVTLSS